MDIPDSEQPDWFLDEIESEETDFSFTEYDLSTAPNDFNIKTIYDFIEQGVLNIPGFQRNYVWDIKRASKLIESLIMGLPVPQVFLFEEDRNNFLLIDGQQRLMTIYYFMKQKFPNKSKRIEIRKIFSKKGTIPDEILHNNEFFSDFNLQLGERVQQSANALRGLNYSTLAEHKITFDLRTIRNVIVRQNSPNDGGSAVYEIFHRLNSGGVVLKPQEIRSSIYHSNFYKMLYRINENPDWRDLIGRPYPDLHLKDIEILLRGYALLINGDKYSPSMTKFLNTFSNEAKQFSADLIRYLERLFEAFIKEAKGFGTKAFTASKTNRINVSAYEAIFTAMVFEAFNKKELSVRTAKKDRLQSLYKDDKFLSATLTGTAGSTNVHTRIARAKQIL